MFGIGVSYGITPLVAQADGQGDRHKITRLLRHGIILCLFTSVCAFTVWVFTVLCFRKFFSTRGSDRLGKPYFYVILASMLPMMLFQNFRQFTEGLSITKPTMFITIGANVINVILNYLLIYGKFGFPELGLIGAGWGTLISRVFMALGMMLYVAKSKKTQYYRAAFKIFSISVAYFKPMLKIGVPSGIQFLFEVSAFAGAALLMGKLGVVPLAAHQIAISLVSIELYDGHGYCAASTVRIGNQIGRRDAFNFNRAGNTSFVMALVFMACCSVVYITFHNFFPTLYIDDPEVIKIAGSLIIVAGFFQLSDGVQVVGLGSLGVCLMFAYPLLLLLWLIGCSVYLSVIFLVLSWALAPKAFGMVCLRA